MPALPRTKYDGIQTLRFVAALLVVITHSTFYAGERLDTSIQTWHFGEVGVDIFFVISGFVMMISTGSLVGRKDGWKFFGMRRLVRIVPMYWIATTVKLATLVALPGAVLHAQLNPGNIALSYLFLPSRNVDGQVEPLLGVGWTLTFEMFFYFIFTVALLLKAKPIWFCGIVLSVFAIGTVFRGDDWPPAAVYFNPIILYFLVGMVIGQWTQDRSFVRLSIWMGYIVVLWAAIPALDGTFSTNDVEKFIRHVGVAALLLAVVMAEPLLAGRIPGPVIYMGDASYSLYLFHPLLAPLVPVVLAVVGLKVGWLSVTLSVVGVVIAAALIFRFVERPITRVLQARLPYVRRHSPATVEPAPTSGRA
ncbi:acyltransferase family protein [Herbiconiux sp. UC225_62]|uniref:acyltransferase family protein n=1 Tax=Herbiconiux sp. UC225_62 TaxID=3350168 RepID=UPI0036D3B333